MANVYIGFGSNIGDRFAHINRALHLLLEAEGVAPMQISSLYETEPVGYKNQHWFINGVIAIETKVLPRPLLALLKTFEYQIGREQRSRWGPREIDLDLLIFGDQCVDTPELSVPHPEMQRRRFVLLPFAEIAPDVVHPILGKNVHTLLSELTGPEVVHRVAPPPIKIPKQEDCN